MPRRFRTLNELPLFAGEEELADAIMGPGNRARWRQVVRSLERCGFPKIDALLGGRYTPAIRTFFDREHGIGTEELKPRIEDEPERLGSWRQMRLEQRTTRSTRNKKAE